jgi:hypothetical protein
MRIRVQLSFDAARLVGLVTHVSRGNVVRIARSRSLAALALVSGSVVFASAAQAATLAVDDDGVECPAAAYSSIQAAVDAARPGDTIAVCPGDYAEGTGAIGSNGLTIQKSLTIRGAGADLVRVTPKASTPVSGRILEDGTASLHNGVGDVVAVVGAPENPISVDISGITVDGHTPVGTPVVVEAGILYLDAEGTLDRDRVTHVVTSEADEAYNAIGGFRASQAGYGIAQSSNAILAPVDGTRLLTISNTRVDKYNRIGILVDGSRDETATPVVGSGAINRAALIGDQIVGRTECSNYAGSGNCATVGLLTTGPLFGQDGVRATSNARVTIVDSLISQNLVNGTGAPTRSTVSGSGTVTPNATNNANLRLGAGVRLQGAALNLLSSSVNLALSSIANSNIADNASGVLNLAADGTATLTGNPTATTSSRGNVLVAENNWWGLSYFRTTNPGPAIAPTDNPPVPENGVTGTATADSYTTSTGTVVSGSTSNSVDFFPFRSGAQADPFNGEYALTSAPLPANDAPPTLALQSDADAAAAGASVVLTADAADDFGVGSVRFYDGSKLLSSQRLGPFRQAVTIPAGAACGATKTYTVIAADSAGQTKSASTGVTVECAATPTPAPTVTQPATLADAPTISWLSTPTRIAAARTLGLSVKAPSGVKSVVVTLGLRTVCTTTQTAVLCRLAPTSADVGVRTLRAVVTDALGRSAEVATQVRVAKFAPRALSLTVTDTRVKGGKLRRTVTGTLKRPVAVTAADGCTGNVTVMLRRDGRTFLDQQVALSKSCSFTRSVTASRRTGGRVRFEVRASFPGNAVLTAITSSRRFH